MRRIEGRDRRRIFFGYGIKANNDWEATLGAQWRHYEESFPLLKASSIDTVSLESHHSNVPLEVVEMVRGKRVMLGSIDVTNDAVETAGVVALTLRIALEYVDADKYIATTNCCMAPFHRDVALTMLSALSSDATVPREEVTGVRF